MTTIEAAAAIVGVYDTHSQFEAVASQGCGEWESERAAELADEHGLSSAEIESEIVRMCQSRC